jgi:hypothetical protein
MKYISFLNPKMKYIVTCEAPRKEDFEKWGVTSSHSTMSISLTVYDEELKLHSSFNVAIEGEYAGYSNGMIIGSTFCTQQNGIDKYSEEEIDNIFSKGSEVWELISETTKGTYISNLTCEILEAIFC